MEWFAELWRRFHYLLHRGRLERELREEMQAHREMQGPAGPRFGNELRLREEAADQWGWAWLDRLEQDVRFGGRLLRRAPAFTLTAIVVLALGIGSNLAAFQVFDAVALSWLPVRSPQTLVNLSSRTSRGHSTSFSYPEYHYYRSHASSLAGTFALVYGAVELNGVADTAAEFVNAGYFTDLGAQPLAGRLFDPGDERPGAAAVTLLDERLWRTRFGGDPAIVGRTAQVNGHPFVVVGILPASFTGFQLGRAGIWIPVTEHAAAFTGSTLLEDWASKGSVRFYARLRDGVPIAAAQAELAGLASALHRERPADTPEGEWIDVQPAGKYLSLDHANWTAVSLAFALVLLVLVTACMNLGVLVLARTLGRDREFALRLSVGASRPRIVRQLMTEHVMLGLLGAAAGCAIAAIAVRAFAAATDFPPALTPRLGLRSVAVAVALAVTSALIFGLTPALQAMRPAVSRRLRLRSVLIAVQIACASVLLIVSGLLVRAVTHVTRVPLGFDYEHALVADPDLPAHGIKTAAAIAYWRRVDERVRQVAGVVETSLTTLPPFGNRLTLDGEGTVYYGVTSSYFATLSIPVVRGRIFRDGETGVGVVSESLARRRWPGADPIGQTFHDTTVIGVVGSARTVRIGEASAAEYYRALDPREMPAAFLVVRTAGRPHDVAATIASIARDQAVGLSPLVQSLDDAFNDKLGAPRQVARVASALGVTSMLLAVMGLGGLIAFTVSQRTREIGVRVALGARPAHVVSAVVSQFRTPILCGALGGSLLAAGVGTILSSELYGISQFDPLAHGAALLLFASVAICAAVPSVRRALRVDPATTLRAE